MNTLHFTPTTVSVDLGGTPISIETGRIAKQANGSVVVRQGGTMVLAPDLGPAYARTGRGGLPGRTCRREAG